MTIAAVVFPTGEYTVRRTLQGAYDDAGQYTPGEQTTFTIVADVQPVEGDLVLNLPAGMRADATRVVFTAAELKALDELNGIAADLLELEGALWRVVRVQRFRALAERSRAWVERLPAT